MHMIIIMITAMVTTGTTIITTTVMATTTTTITTAAPMITLTTTPLTNPPATPGFLTAAPIRRVSRSPA